MKALTSEEFMGKVLVILAGYESDMEKMLLTNPGLKSRFAERVHFDDMDAAAAVHMFESLLKRLNLEFPHDVGDLVPLANRLVGCSDFSNGRDVETWSKFTYQKVREKEGAIGRWGASAIGTMSLSERRTRRMTLWYVAGWYTTLQIQFTCIQS